MMGAHGLYIATISSLMFFPLYDLLPVENFICDRCESARIDSQPNPPHICQTSLPVYHSRSEFLPKNF